MPTYKITIYTRTGEKMKGERWHPSHDIETVTSHYTKLAKEKVGNIKFERIEIVMTDNDSAEPKKKEKILPFTPTPRRKDLKTPGVPLKDRNKSSQ